MPFTISGQTQLESLKTNIVSSSIITASNINNNQLLVGNANHGLISLGSAGTSGQYLKATGTLPSWTSPGALVRTNDTNVTLSFTGTT